MRRRIAMDAEIKAHHNNMYPSPADEIALGTFNFKSYWAECEANTGKKMSIEDVWEELISDLNK